MALLCVFIDLAWHTFQKFLGGNTTYDYCAQKKEDRLWISWSLGYQFDWGNFYGC